MKIGALLIVSAALLMCIPVWADPIGYTETFNSGSNMDWGTDRGWPDELFSSNYDEDGAGYSSTGGDGGGYVYVNAYTWTPTLIFADSDASGGALAGNRDYTSLASLAADMKWNGTGEGYVYFLLASTLDSSTDPVGATNLTMFLMNGQSLLPSSDWTHFTADLTNPDNWWSWFGPADFSSVVADVDLVGALWYGPNDAELGVDNFVGTPEPGLLLTMAPLAGFLAWRLRRRRQPNRT